MRINNIGDLELTYFEKGMDRLCLDLILDKPVTIESEKLVAWQNHPDYVHVLDKNIRSFAHDWLDKGVVIVKHDKLIVDKSLLTGPEREIELYGLSLIPKKILHALTQTNYSEIHISLEKDEERENEYHLAITIFTSEVIKKPNNLFKAFVKKFNKALAKSFK